MDMQNVSNLEIPEGEVRTIHDKDGRLLWGRVHYDTRYAGDTYQQTYSGKNLINWRAGSSQDITIKQNADGSISVSGVPSTTYPNITNRPSVSLPAGTYTISIGNAIQNVVNIAGKYQGSNRIALSTIPIGSTSATITTTDTLVEIDLWFTAVVGTAVDFTIYPMVETGSTATSYEPYVGGTASPNPDYPQTVNLVTGEQTVSVTGKNLFNVDGPSGAYRATKTISGQSLTATATANGVGYVSVVLPNSETLLGKSCTISFSAQASVGDARIRIMSCLSSSPDIVGSLIADKNGNGEQTRSFTFPDSFDPEKDAFAVLFYPSTSNIAIGDSATYSNIQLELGSSPTTYEPYQSQSYPISLGSTELCKIGDYQDYIYKSGDDWYVHKECGKLLGNSTSWTNNGVTSTRVQGVTDVLNVSPNIQSDDFYYMYYANILANGDAAKEQTSDEKIHQASGTTSQSRVRVTIGAYWTPDWGTFVRVVQNLVLYYALATPTDTKITNQTLIGQLNAVHEWLTRYGYYGGVSGNLPMIIDRTNL